MKITLCGSIAFIKNMEELESKLIALGHEIKIPELKVKPSEIFGDGKKPYLGGFIADNGGMDSFPEGHEIWDVKEAGIRDHFEKIDWADAILVVNEDKRGITGYVGGNTLIEIGVAFYTHKKIFILNEVSQELTYKQEILGMKPTILNGDLGLIK